MGKNKKKKINIEWKKKNLIDWRNIYIKRGWIEKMNESKN